MRCAFKWLLVFFFKIPKDLIAPEESGIYATEGLCSAVTFLSSMQLPYHISKHKGKRK